jgi:hypothetical protein
MCARILEADYQIDCESAEYSHVQGMAVPLVLIVEIGVPTVLVAVVLCDIWTLRRRQTYNGALARSPEKFYGVTAERKGHPLFDRYEFFQAGYKPTFVLWAVLELCFAAMMLGLVFMGRGSAIQVWSENQTWVYILDFPLTAVPFWFRDNAGHVWRVLYRACHCARGRVPAI